MSREDLACVLFDCRGRVSAARRCPVGVEGQHEIGRSVHYVFEVEVAAWDALELELVVVIEEFLACLLDFFNCRSEVVGEAFEALEGAGLVVEDTADADPVAAEQSVLLDDLVGLLENAVGARVGQDNLESGVVNRLFDSFGADGAESRNLDLFIADGGDLVHGSREILFVLHKVAHGIELCAEYHLFRHNQ